MNKKLLLLISVFILLTGCSSKKNEVTSSINSDNDSVSESVNSDSKSSKESSEESSSESEVLNTEHKLITFKGSNTRSNMQGGAQLSNAGPKNATIALFNDEKTILNDLTATSVTYQRFGGDSTGLTSLTIGTGSAGGNLQLDFNVQIVEIKVKIQAYFNQYNGGTSSDANAEITINDNYYELSNDGNVVTEEFEKTIALYKVTSLTFSNDEGKQRTYINELDITYVVE